MTRPETLFSFLYCSVLSPDQPTSCIADIVRTAREINANLNLSGLLVFDGHRFCQYLEGPQAPLAQILEKIMIDSRHTEVFVQHHGPAPDERKFKTWAIAYADVDDPKSLEFIAQTTGPEALQRLNQLLPSLDCY